MSRTRLLRSALLLAFFGGVALMLWPLGQTAYGWWSQRTLRAAWEAFPTRNARVPSGQGTRKTKATAPITKIAPTKRKARTLRTPSRPEGTRALRTQEWLPTRIVIPDIGLDAVVVQGMDMPALRRGPGHDPQSARPGQPGNCVIAGHRNVFGAWFADLDKLWAGSLIELRTPQRIFVYRALASEEVFENDTSVLQNDAADPTPRLTLITCTRPAGLYRHIVTAELLP